MMTRREKPTTINENSDFECITHQTSAPVSLRMRYAGMRARSFNDTVVDDVVVVVVDEDDVVVVDNDDDDDDDDATAVNAVVRDAVSLRALLLLLLL
jgi:hypothetical protein